MKATVFPCGLDRLAPCLVVCLFLVLPAASAAQELPGPGDLIRVTPDPGPIRAAARFEGYTDSAIVVWLTGADARLVLPMENVTRLEVRVPGRRWLAASVMGLAGGAALGGATYGWVVFMQRAFADLGEPDKAARARVSAVAGGVGLGVGLVVGWLIPGTRWAEVAMPASPPHADPSNP